MAINPITKEKNQMKKSLSPLLAVFMIVGILFSACAPKATEAPAAAEVPAATVAAPAEDTVVSMVPAKSGSPFDINGKVVCYIIPSLANPFLNGVATSVTEQFKADGVTVNVYGADEGGLNQQFDQIENCISRIGRLSFCACIRSIRSSTLA
jgi:ABC-type sugar transport system substrate-binding protein